MKSPGTVLLAVVAAMSLQACATILTGRTQTIQVRSEPPDVLVTVQPGGYRATTPGSLTLPRLGSGYLLRFEKNGFEPVSVRLESSTNGLVWGNILIGGLIGLAVDYNTGAAYSMSPSDVQVRLSQLQTGMDVQGRDGLVVFDSQGALLLAVQLQ